MMDACVDVNKHAADGGGDADGDDKYDDAVTAVLNERYSTDNQLHRRLQQRIHNSPHVYTELALTDTSTILQVGRRDSCGVTSNSAPPP